VRLVPEPAADGIALVVDPSSNITSSRDTNELLPNLAYLVGKSPLKFDNVDLMRAGTSSRLSDLR
jgi:hypothetical protein